MQKSENKEWTQILAVLLSSLVALSCGILFTWPSPSIPKLTDPSHPLHLTLEEASYFSVLPPTAAVLSSFVFAALLDKVGRRPTLLFIAIPHLLSWVLIAFSSSVWMFYASRLMTGIADAAIFAALPVYVGEVSSPKIRGSWGNAITFFIFSGSLLMNSVGAYFDIQTTTYIFGVIPIVYFVGFWFMPESPYYFIMKDRDVEAMESLRWLRQRQDVDEEFRAISSAIKRQLAEPSSIKDLFKVGTNRKAVVIGGVMRFAQQFSGISAFSVYSQFLFGVAGGNMSAATSAIICSAVQACSSVIGSILLDKLGRRKSMFLSGFGCNLILILMATFLFINTNTSIDLSSILWFPIAGMILFIVLFSLGLGVVPTLMLGELFSSSIKGKALAVMNVLFGIYVGSSTKIFQVLVSNFGLFSPFVFYGVCTFFSMIACYFLIPETMGKTLEDIQLELQGHKSRKVEPVKDLALHI